MILGVIGFILMSGLGSLARAASASLIMTPRFESLHGVDGKLAERGILKVKASGQAEPYAFYIEGFGEGETQENSRDSRRVPSEFILQEAYLEFKLNSFYLRAGKQAMRWSEMWVLPSLDLWTGRRWNRLLYDPQPEQLDHSGGVSMAWVREGWSIEGVALSEVARTRFPQPLPETLDHPDRENISGGFRAKADVAGAGFSVVAGKAHYFETVGGSLNYAFETFVPKIEIGQKSGRPPGLARSIEKFGALGIDFFWGDLTLQPQLTLSQVEDDLGQMSDPEIWSYCGLTWVRNRHEVQAQVVYHDPTADSFINIFYAQNIKDWIQIGTFAQNYEGSGNTLFGLYREMTGGWVLGLRLEMNMGWSTP